MTKDQALDPIADALLAHYLTPPPAPAQPKWTWCPSMESRGMLLGWVAGSESSLTFLRRLYAQLHRDRVAALPNPGWADRDDLALIASGRTRFSIPRSVLLSLADDGNGEEAAP